MNIPEKILQYIADEAFAHSPSSPLWCVRNGTNWEHQPNTRRAVIQHALNNPAIAPFLAGGIGEYTDQAIYDAWEKAVEDKDAFPDRMRTFLAALPSRESPAPVPSDALPAVVDVLNAAGWSGLYDSQWAKLKDALPRLAGILVTDAAARAEKAEADAAVNYGMLLAARERAEKAEAELATLKSAQLGILRPIAEMPETVPDGCVVVTGWNTQRHWTSSNVKSDSNTHFAILRLPAEAPLPAECAINHTEQSVQFRDTAGYCMICGTDWPEPAAHMPLGPEDVPPGSTLRAAQGHWFIILHVEATGVTIRNVNGYYHFIEWHELKDEGWQINTSIPNTGRWDKDAWRPCSKPAGKEVAK